MSRLWAHSVNSWGVRHRLDDHLQGTADLAREFAGVFGAGGLGFFLGLVHDAGKARVAWQRGLLRAEAGGGRVRDEVGRSIDHKRAGTWLAARRAGLGVFAMVVWGHHGGLRDRAVLRDALTQAQRDPAREEVEQAVSAVEVLIPEIASDCFVELPQWVSRGADPLAVELLVRMVFSAVVDADVLDTREHYHGGPRRDSVSLSTLVEVFEANRKQLLEDRLATHGPSPVDEDRARVYDEVVAAAESAGEPGVFPFAAPTGAGKTIAAAGFGVHHARRRGLARMIVAVPFRSVTVQTAGVYRGLFGSENVLEHHSGVDVDGLPEDQRRAHRLMVENWDCPVVVTTTVQLFESLFDYRPGAMRKLHRLAGSVLILDEVQALPDAMLLPILSALRHLTEYFGVSVVLASATQPDFFALDIFGGLSASPLISRPQELFDQLRRVRFRWWDSPRPTFAEVAAEIAESGQVLAIVNTTSDAARLHDLVKRSRRPEDSVLHLSTRMAAGHIREVLDRATALLAEGLPVVLVSTQLVEAGVDLDFPRVYRASATAEALLQAAGRCNRNGLLSEGIVVVFVPTDGDRHSARMIYGSALDITRAHFGPGRELDDVAAMTRYYRTRYAVDNIENLPTARRIQALRGEFNFTKVAELFAMIDERTLPVVAPYGDTSERQQILDALRGSDPADPAVYRRLQPYIAGLPRHLVKRAEAEGLARVVIGDLYEWTGDYHADRGIDYGTGVHTP